MSDKDDNSNKNSSEWTGSNLLKRIIGYSLFIFFLVLHFTVDRTQYIYPSVLLLGVSGIYIVLDLLAINEEKEK